MHGHRLRGALALLGGTAATTLAPGVALAHGAVPAEAPSIASIALDWSLEPTVVVALLAAAMGWLLLVRRRRLQLRDSFVNT